MPLAFAAHAGSLLVLTASPVNVIVSEAADDAGVGRFGFFEFALVGVPLVAGTVAIVVLFGERLLPDRTPRATTRDFSAHARTLVDQYGIDARTDVLLTRGLGRGRGRDPAAFGARSARRCSRAWSPTAAISSSSRCSARARSCPGETVLAVGDTLLLREPGARSTEHLDDPEVLVVDEPELVRRQAVPLGPGAKRALAVLAAMVVLLATGAVPPAVAGLLAAGAIVVTRRAHDRAGLPRRSRGRP